MQFKKCMNKGCQIYAIQVTNLLEKKNKPSLEYFSVLHEFRYLFVDKILEFPPRREIDFSIDLLPRSIVGRLVVVIDVNPSHGFWTARLIKVFGHEGQCTCIYNTHEWIVYIMLFPVVCGTSRGSSWLRRNEFLKMTK
jgi:hypothetical protein